MASDAYAAGLTRGVLWLVLAIAAAGCATVRPEQRAVLADPMMQFDSAPERPARARVLENREGALSGGSVKGGGCGCN